MDRMNGIDAAQLIASPQAEQEDVWPADLDSAKDIADSCPDRQHVIAACIEGRRQRFGEHPLLITDNYSHFRSLWIVSSKDRKSERRRDVRIGQCAP